MNRIKKRTSTKVFILQLHTHVQKEIFVFAKSKENAFSIVLLILSLKYPPASYTSVLIEKKPAATRKHAYKTCVQVIMNMRMVQCAIF